MNVQAGSFFFGDRNPLAFAAYNLLACCGQICYIYYDRHSTTGVTMSDVVTTDVSIEEGGAYEYQQ